MSASIAFTREEALRSPASLSAVRRDPHARVVGAMLTLGGETARVEQTHTRPWASATFVGAQHFITLMLSQQAADELAMRLPDATFRVPGHIVADAVIDQRTETDNGVRVELVILTIEEW